MTPDQRAAIREILASMRAETGGAVASYLDADGTPSVADGDADSSAWRAVLADAATRWPLWQSFDRAGSVTGSPADVYALWLDGSGAVLIELGPDSSVGLARLRLRPLVAQLCAIVENHVPLLR